MQSKVSRLTKSRFAHVLVTWTLVYTKQAKKDAKILAENPSQTPQLLDVERTVKVMRMWTHYE